MKTPIKTKQIFKILNSVKKESSKSFNILIIGEKNAGKKSLIDNLAKNSLAQEGLLSLNIENQRVEYHPEFTEVGKKADIILILLDATKSINRNLKSYYDYSRRKFKKLPLLVLNKIDLNPRVESLLYDIYQIFDVKPSHVYLISARNNINIDQPLIEGLLKGLKEKEIAVSRSLPRFRKTAARLITKRTAQQNGIIGAVTIIPGTDMPILMANQIKMILQISAIYDKDLSMERITEILFTIGSGYTWRALARQLLDFIPGVGWIIKGSVAFTGTHLIGEAAIKYFEKGGILTPNKLREFLENVTKRLKVGRG